MLEINYTRTQWGIEFKWKSRKYFSNIFVLLFSALLISVRSHSIQFVDVPRTNGHTTAHWVCRTRIVSFCYFPLYIIWIFIKRHTHIHISPCAPAKGSTVNADGEQVGAMVRTLFCDRFYSSAKIPSTHNIRPNPVGKRKIQDGREGKKLYLFSRQNQ